MRGFVVVALLCIAFAIIYQAVGCQPDMTGCSWNDLTKQYDCPEER